MTHTHHSIDYVELVASELGASKQFYADAFGWEFTDYGPSYAGVHGPDHEAGGLTAQAEPGATTPLVILYSDDLEATLEAVRAADGRIVREPYAFPGGRRFHFRDPAGTELAVWSPQ